MPEGLVDADEGEGLEEDQTDKHSATDEGGQQDDHDEQE